MKLKITSYHLMVVVIVQIILINVFLTAFFISRSNVVKSANTGDEIYSNKEFKSHGRVKGGIGNRDPLLELINKTKLPDNSLKVYKIQDFPGQKAEFIATAYDLSYKSCGKYPSHPMYGYTFSGKKATKGRTIAVDPEFIPLGSEVYVEFPGNYSYLDGFYTAEDTGSKVKGKIIDIFLGESAFYEIEKFGSMPVLVSIVK